MKCIFTTTMPQMCTWDIHVKLYVFYMVTVDEHSDIQRSQKFWKAYCLLLDNGEAQWVHLYTACYKYTGDRTARSPEEKSWLVTNHWQRQNTKKMSLFCVRIDQTSKNQKLILLTIFVAIIMFSLQAILIPPSSPCIYIHHCPSSAAKCGGGKRYI